MILSQGGPWVTRCDHLGCVRMLDSEKNLLWRMFRVTFGIHPDIEEKIEAPHVATLQSYDFCAEHDEFYENLVLALIATNFEGSFLKISRGAFLEEGLGCWITLDYRKGKKTLNFQVPYQVYKAVYKGLPHFQSPSTAECLTERFQAFKNYLADF